MINWENTTDDRFVAFLDIMGFKERVLRSSHEAILHELESLSDQINFLELSNNITYGEELKRAGETMIFKFSDSIIIFTKASEPNDFLKFLADTQIILNKAIELGIPIKGAFSYGKMTVDTIKSIYFGQPLIDAFLLHEELELYGVVADHSFESMLDDPRFNMLKDAFVKYKVQLKGGSINHYLLNPLNKIITKEKILTSLADYYKKVSGKPRGYLDNTIKFIETIEPPLYSR